MTTRRIILMLIVIIVVLVWLRNSQQAPTATSPSASNRAPYSITNENGTIRIPGTAYVEAFDPATNSNIPAINVRTEPRSAQAPICQLEDNDRVNVDDSRNADGSAWLHITSGNCTGWILSMFITPVSN